MYNTEVSGGSPDMASVLKYIAEREDNLGKYSDKLRQNVQRIFDVFGSHTDCQICGKDTHRGHGKFRARRNGNRPKWMPEATDTIPDMYARMATPEDGDHGKDGVYTLWEDNPDQHVPIPKIDVSISLRSSVFYQEDGSSWAIDMDNRGLAFFHEHEDGSTTTPNAYEVSRIALKVCIQKGSLTAFLQKIAETLKQESEEYQEVADIAEKMAQAIL